MYFVSVLCSPKFGRSEKNVKQAPCGRRTKNYLLKVERNQDDMKTVRQKIFQGTLRLFTTTVHARSIQGLFSGQPTAHYPERTFQEEEAASRFSPTIAGTRSSPPALLEEEQVFKNKTRNYIIMSELNSTTIAMLSMIEKMDAYYGASSWDLRVVTAVVRIFDIIFLPFMLRLCQYYLFLYHDHITTTIKDFQELLLSHTFLHHVLRLYF